MDNQKAVADRNLSYRTRRRITIAFVAWFTLDIGAYEPIWVSAR